MSKVVVKIPQPFLFGMTRYILRRLFLFIPTLLAISLLAFGMSKMSNVSIVDAKCTPSDDSPFESGQAQQERCEAIAKDYGLDKPVFYFAIRQSAYPPDLYKIYNLRERKVKSNLIAQYGNWDYIRHYFKTCDKFRHQIQELPDSINADLKIEINASTNFLYNQYEHERIQFFLEDIVQKMRQDSLVQAQLNPTFQEVATAYNLVQTRPSKGKLYTPAFHWYGLDNQYHNWFFSFIRGKFGKSYIDERPIATKIWEALHWTLTINSIAILLAYFIAVPLGVVAATQRNTWKDTFVSTFLFMLYALPSFWVATLLIVFFTTSEYGMNFFPTGGTGKGFWDVAYHLVLPVFCVTYAAFVFISRQMRGGMLDVLHQDFIKTAKAKGLNSKQTIWKHGFRNALFPIITMFASVFPRALTGSVVIEYIFRVPGMGWLAWESFISHDWITIYTLLMLGAILTMLGNLVADILYAWADPRVKFE